jgi:hypothetical protein
MATVEKIYVGIDNERVELTGEDLKAFKAQRTKDQAEAKARQAEIDARVAARESAHWQNLQPLGYQLRRLPRYE